MLTNGGKNNQMMQKTPFSGFQHPRCADEIQPQQPDPQGPHHRHMYGVLTQCNFEKISGDATNLSFSLSWQPYDPSPFNSFPPHSFLFYPAILLLPYSPNQIDDAAHPTPTPTQLQIKKPSQRHHHYCPPPRYYSFWPPSLFSILLCQKSRLHPLLPSYTRPTSFLYWIHLRYHPWQRTYPVPKISPSTARPICSLRVGSQVLVSQTDSLTGALYLRTIVRPGIEQWGKLWSNCGSHHSTNRLSANSFYPEKVS